MQEIKDRVKSVLITNGKVKAKLFKKWLGISPRMLRYVRVDIEKDFISDISDTLIEADNSGYYIVDIQDDEQVNSFMKRRKSMIFTSLKMLYKLEKAINRKRSNFKQTTFYDFIDEFKESYDQEDV